MLLAYTNTDFEDVLYHEGDGKSVPVAFFPEILHLKILYYGMFKNF